MGCCGADWREKRARWRHSTISDGANVEDSIGEKKLFSHVRERGSDEGCGCGVQACCCSVQEGGVGGVGCLDAYLERVVKVGEREKSEQTLIEKGLRRGRGHLGGLGEGTLSTARLCRTDQSNGLARVKLLPPPFRRSGFLRRTPQDGRQTA